jgi:hypothetical protein
MRVRGLASVLSGLCAQAVLVPDKGFKIPVLSPLLWTLQGQRLNHACEEIKILRKSAARELGNVRLMFHVHSSRFLVYFAEFLLDLNRIDEKLVA